MSFEFSSSIVFGYQCSYSAWTLGFKDQGEYVFELSYSTNFCTPEDTFYIYLGITDDDFVNINKYLKGNAKMMGRKFLIAKLLKHDPTQEIWLEIRIKLPYEV